MPQWWSAPKQIFLPCLKNLRISWETNRRPKPLVDLCRGVWSNAEESTDKRHIISSEPVRGLICSCLWYVWRYKSWQACMITTLWKNWEFYESCMEQYFLNSIEKWSLGSAFLHKPPWIHEMGYKYKKLQFCIFHFYSKAKEEKVQGQLCLVEVF